MVQTNIIEQRIHTEHPKKIKMDPRTQDRALGRLNESI